MDPACQILYNKELTSTCGLSKATRSGYLGVSNRPIRPTSPQTCMTLIDELRKQKCKKLKKYGFSIYIRRVARYTDSLLFFLTCQL